MGVPTPSSDYKFPYAGLITLAIAIFLSVTIEMLPTGLLPEMSAELGVRESFIGLTVTVFAFTVVLTSTALTAATRRFSRHTLVVSVLVIFSVSVMFTAIAPSYEWLVASRILGGLAHGLFWAVVGAYSAYLVPKEYIGRAVAITLGGGSLAFVLGVPLGTALGHLVGWRMSFVVLAILTLIGALFVYVFLPRVDNVATGGHISTATGGIEILTAEHVAAAPGRKDHSVLAVVFVCLITALLMVGQYSFYTFFTIFFTRVVGIPEDQISGALFAYGIVGAVSLVLVAVWLGRHPRVSLMVSMVALLVAILLLAFLPNVFVVAALATVIWALAMGNLPPLLQTRMLHATSARIRDAASAFYTTAFNVGIGGGALVGAIALDSLGIESLPFIYAAIIALAIGLILASDAILARRGAAKVVSS
ncbi:MAG: MFS transporter [Microbacteriaceae bacterium]